MNELSPHEIAAIEGASAKGGAFLEHVGQTDLAKLSEGDWMTFIETVAMSYADEMAMHHAPMAVLRSQDDPFTGPIREDEIPY